MAKEELKLRLPVVPELDKRGTQSLIKDVRSLENQLGKIGISYKDLAKTSQTNVSELKKLATAASVFGSTLSKTTKDSVKKLQSLGDQLESARKAAATLEAEYSSSKDAKVKAAKKQQYDQVMKSVAGLNKEVDKFASSNKRNLKTLEQSMSKFNKAAEYKSGDMVKGVSAGLAKLFTKGGAGAGIRGVASSIGQGAQGAAGRAHISAMESGGSPGMMADMVGVLSKAGPAVAAAGAAVMMFAKVLSAASNHMTGLNKALIEGTGSANDFVSDTNSYKTALDDLRVAAIGAAGSMLKYGMNSESMLKVVNAYAKESTGSLIKTRNAMAELGKGNVQAGLQHFSESALAYGKALGMSAEETAGMMGKFQNEVGYGFDQVESTMNNVVKAAATANMPMTKFMDIFKSVIPDVELYQNRIEELTGTIKLLSKTMSAKDIKNFEASFAKGFKGTDFKQRMKTMFIAGQGNVSKALESDFQAKADTIGKSLSKYVDPAEFQKAFKGGSGPMADLLAKAQAAASAKGEQLSGADVSNAMKLAQNEASRKKGGLDLVTAMSGGGQLATYKILKAQSQAFTSGFSGLSEHVIKATGVSEQQYDALRDMDRSMQAQKAMLKDYGKTNSKSMNKALREQIMMRKGRKPGDVSAKEMASATEDELFAAAERSNDDKKAREQAGNLAEMQYTVTTSIGDKLDNYIGFLLEKIYNVLQPVLDVLDDLFSWLTGNQSSRDIKKMTDVIILNNKYLTSEGQQTVKDVSEAVQNGLNAGLSGDDLNKSLANDTNVKDILTKMSTYGADSDLAKFLDSLKLSDQDKVKKQNQIGDNIKNGDLAAALKAMEDLPGGMEKNLVNLADLQAIRGKGSDASAAKVGGRAQMRGGKSSGYALAPSQAIAAAEAGDVEDMNAPGSGSAQSAAGDMASSVNSSAMNNVQAVQDAVISHADTADKHVDVAEKQKEIADDTYAGINDMAGVLKKGIKFEQGWMGTKYRNVLKDASLDAMRKALMEYAVLEEKIKGDSGLRQALSGGQGWNFAAGGQQAIDAVLGADTGGGADALQKAGVGGFATGGPVNYDQIAKVHSGEFVVPKNGALVSPDSNRSSGKKSGGGGVIIQSMHVEHHGGDSHSLQQQLYDLQSKGT